MSQRVCQDGFQRPTAGRCPRGVLEEDTPRAHSGITGQLMWQRSEGRTGPPAAFQRALKVWQGYPAEENQDVERTIGTGPGIEGIAKIVPIGAGAKLPHALGLQNEARRAAILPLDRRGVYYQVRAENEAKFSSRGCAEGHSVPGARDNHAIHTDPLARGRSANVTSPGPSIGIAAGCCDGADGQVSIRNDDCGT